MEHLLEQRQPFLQVPRTLFLSCISPEDAITLVVALLKLQR